MGSDVMIKLHDIALNYNTGQPMKVVLSSTARQTAVYHMSAQAGSSSRDIWCITVSIIIVSRVLIQSTAIAVLETEGKSISYRDWNLGGKEGEICPCFPSTHPP